MVLVVKEHTRPRRSWLKLGKVRPNTEFDKKLIFSIEWRRNGTNFVINTIHYNSTTIQIFKNRLKVRYQEGKMELDLQELPCEG